MPAQKALDTPPKHPKQPLIGNRIRDFRIQAGVKQADLARTCDISPSYLNLIEHNKRSVGGKLLVNIAKHLNISARMLNQGIDETLLNTLKAASDGIAKMHQNGPDDMLEMAYRFPQWVKVIKTQSERIKTLEKQVTKMGDRLTHDPFFQTSVHEILSSATVIRSTAAILARSHDISLDWLGRFHRNILDDANRLVTASNDLVTYLDETDDETGDNHPPPISAGKTILPPSERPTPADEASAFLDVIGPHIQSLELGAPVGDVFASNAALSEDARDIVHTYLTRYRQDAARISMATLTQALDTYGNDPFLLAAYLSAPLDCLLRRLAHLPAPTQGKKHRHQFGLLLTNDAGFVTYRKPLPGFSGPRFEAACPLWPIRRALEKPGHPVAERVTQLGRQSRPLIAYTIATPRICGDTTSPPVIEATMLLAPESAPQPARAHQTKATNQGTL